MLAQLTCCFREYIFYFILAEFQNMGMGTQRMRLMVWFNMRLAILNGMSHMTGAMSTMINQLCQIISVINNH
jgi:hypothetical protein